VADILHVSPKTVSRWAKEGKLPFLKTLGGHRRNPEGLAGVAGRFARVEPLGTAAAPFGGHRQVELSGATEPEVAGSLTPAPAFLFLRRPRPRVLGPPLEAINHSASGRGRQPTAGGPSQVPARDERPRRAGHTAPRMTVA
jgi:excisionase family DNA binding protein